MSPTVARPITWRRIAATAALALIATTGVAQGLTPRASAAPADNASFTWLSAALTTDRGTPGVPDPGDIVTLTFEVTVSPGAPGNLNWLILVSSGYFSIEGPEALAPGSSRTYTTDVYVTRPMLDALGSGPILPSGTFTFWMTDNGWPRSFDVPAPPLAYTAPTPITVSTGFAMTELHGVLGDSKLVEGDQVHYVTHVTNTSRATLTLTGTGYATPSTPVTLASGASTDFVAANVGVTYADMAAGGVTFADASVSWSVGSLSGTVPAPVGTAPTEAINTSVSYDVETAVHTSTGVSVALGAAVPGDRIDYTFQLTNDGNVVMNYVALGQTGVATAPTSRDNDAVGLVQGASLPSGTYFDAAGVTSNGGLWPAYPLTTADIDRGYVDLSFTIGASPTAAEYSSAYSHTVTTRVFLKNFTTKANLSFTKAHLNDTNGDGIGQEGETITYRTAFKNNADQPLMIDAAGEISGWYLPAPLSGTFNGVTLNAKKTVAQQWDYTITAADVARGNVRAKVFADYHGTSDSATNSRTSSSKKIPTGVYVAPASTLDTAATYVDANADGLPSIGETVHVTVTVTNTGAYALTGLTVADAAGSDVTGLLPAFPASVAGGASAVESFDYVLTAADFARGSLAYSTEMTATGLPTTASSTSVNLTDITFQAYATDLDAMAAGGIQVCESNGTPTDTITLLSTILVHPGDTCTYEGLPYGYRVVGFSTPVLMGTNSFTVTVPTALHVGAHRLALYAPNGTLVGWKAVTAKDPIALAGPDTGAVLAATGTNGDEAVGLGGNAVLLVLLGTAFVVADSRRRKHAGR